ncbi:hypothetical protein ACH5RR_037550 [Cinchona calisaya]|uniref:hAT-like transposase RNase-H fold domain-containing protein n=1 Tax=Cinchona calisaya TaxID=153742 RepID=A0ABD2Y7X2_9GENT
MTSNTIFNKINNAYGILKRYEESYWVDLRSMAHNMKLKYNKYWGNTEKIKLLVYITAILDPRGKFEYVDFVIEDMYGKNANMGRLVKDAIYGLFAKYKRLNQQTISASSPFYYK